MPWSGVTFNRTDGTRVGASVWVDADSAGVNILPSDHDTHDQDIVDGLEETVKHNGDIPMTGDLDMGGNDLDNVGVVFAEQVQATVSSSLAWRSTSTDAGSSSQPNHQYRRLSASPAAGDLGPQFQFKFNDSAIAEQTLLEIKTEMIDPTAGALLGEWNWLAQDGSGSAVEVATIGPLGLGDKGGVLVQSHNSAQLPAQTASGTEVEFSNTVTPGLISADATQIIITFAGLEHADTGVPHALGLQLGVAAGYEGTGYVFALRRLDAALSDTTPTTSWAFAANIEDDPVRGTLVLDRIEGTDTWQITGNVAAVDVPENYIVAGSKTLADTLTRLKLIIDGIETWAAGTVSVTVVT